MKILTDFHHTSLLRSLVLLFENRLNMSVYRPVGMEWFYEGYWSVNNQVDTARQFLDLETQFRVDNTPELNVIHGHSDGIYELYDPGNISTHKGILLEAFKSEKFDYLIASIPAHIPIYEKLIKEYQPSAKLIVQIGNNWDSNIFNGMNVLASVKPGMVQNANVVYYHQEFDTNIFKPSDHKVSKNISSYINILQNIPNGWNDFSTLEKMLNGLISFKSYGGQCRDGNKAGAKELADSMSIDDFVFHVKDHGDGYGHIIYNAYACGRPVILRKSDYIGKLAEELISDNNSIDLDQLSHEECVNLIKNIYQDGSLLEDMSINAYKSFVNNVNFSQDAEKVSRWLATL